METQFRNWPLVNFEHALAFEKRTLDTVQIKLRERSCLPSSVNVFPSTLQLHQ